MQILKIDNGIITPISNKDIKDNDYIISYGDITIVDRDKRVLRPYVEDMLRKMNIETWQIKMLKLLIIISFLQIIFTIFFIFSNYNFGKKINGLNNTISTMNANVDTIKNNTNNIQSQNTSILNRGDNNNNNNVSNDITKPSNSNSELLKNGFINK